MKDYPEVRYLMVIFVALVGALVVLTIILLLTGGADCRPPLRLSHASRPAAGRVAVVERDAPARAARTAVRVPLAPRAGAGAGVPSAASWAALAACESGRDGSWRVGSASPFRGRLQWDPATWAWMGGHGDPARASWAEEVARARALWRVEGWAPWPECARMVGLA